MKTTTHTPGPWHCNLGNGTNLTHDRTLWAGAIPIAAIGDDYAKYYSDTDVANARLIAAAPELLAALRECITSEGAACFGDMDNHPEWMQRRLYAISDIARAAIAKALGQ